MRLAAIGECMVEFASAGDGLYRQGFAGDTFNTAWTLRALARPEDRAVAYVTAVGDDRYSAAFRRFVAEAGIEDGAIRVIPGKAMGLYAIHLDGAERSFSYWRDAAAARRLADDPAFLARALEAVDAAYVSGITLAILDPAGRERLLEALGALRARGGMVAFDPNIRPRLWPDAATMAAATEAGYRAATVALPTFPDEEALFSDGSIERAAERALGYGCAEVVVKAGPEAALVATAAGVERVPAERVARPVDTTGAGDSFNAGYIEARLRGLAPADAARFGHRVAARVIGVRGGLIPAEALADLRAPPR